MSKQTEKASELEANVTEEAVRVEAPLQELVEVSVGPLNLRCGPGYDCPAATTLTVGTRLRVLTELDEVEGWCPVILPERLLLGWVDRQYITAAETAEG